MDEACRIMVEAGRNKQTNKKWYFIESLFLLFSVSNQINDVS